MTSDIDTALEPKPFVYSRFHRKVYKREWMKKRREDSEFRARDAAKQKTFRHISRIASALAACVEDQPGAR